MALKREVQPRLEGESKWSVRSLVRYAVTNIAAFSTAPLHLITVLGCVVFLSSVVLGIHSLWQKLMGQALEGFTTVILLQLLIGSVSMICIGIIGYYISKIYEELKTALVILFQKIVEQKKTSKNVKQPCIL